MYNTGVKEVLFQTYGRLCKTISAVWFRRDYFEHFAPKCSGCGRPIVDNFVSALNRHWHPHCFVCSVRPVSVLFLVNNSLVDLFNPPMLLLLIWWKVGLTAC